jgi:serine/threonine protein kinase
VRAHVAELWPDDQLLKFDRSAKGTEANENCRFLIVRELGSGGSGSVFEAFDLDNGERVAVKMIHSITTSALSPHLFEQTRREIIASGKNLPNGVARVRYLNCGADGVLTIVQDYIEGPSLRVLIEEGTDIGRLLALLSKLARTVADLHKAGVAHRDLKPENIIVEDGIRPVLIDLGASKITGEADTLPTIGTLGYIAPERASRRATTSGSVPFGGEDVYALGRIAMDIWQKTAPVGSPGWIATFLRTLGLRSSLGMPRELATLICEMTEADPMKRCRDLELAADIFAAASKR